MYILFTIKITLLHCKTGLAGSHFWKQKPILSVKIIFSSVTDVFSSMFGSKLGTIENIEHFVELINPEKVVAQPMR